MEQTIISTSSGSSNVAGERRPEIFANNFWGKEEAGYDALMSRLRQAKQTCDEVKNMFQERALIEEEYAKKLMKLSKSPIGKDETGSLRDALEVCRQEMEATAQEHITLSQKIRTELVQEISHFILRQKESRKLQQAIVDRSLRNKREQSVLVQRAKEKYEAECVKITGLLASKNSVMGKDLDKLNLRIEKTQIAAKAADQEYIQLVKNIQITTKTWNYDWKTACDKFQDLEEDRIDKLKSFLWTYANLISTVCVADDESCERIRISLENCNVEKDILIFIRERATGPDIPEPQSYVNFYAGPKENGVRYKRASFDRVPEYVDVITTPTTQLDPNKRLSLGELPITNNNNSKDKCVYHTRNDSDGYSNVNIDRATLYANTTSTKKNNNNNGGIVNEVERTEKNEVEEEPVDPRSKQMLSIGNNVLEVQTNIGQLNNQEDQDEIAKALANLELTDEYNNNNKNDSDVNNDNKDNYDNNDHNSNNNSNDNQVSRFNTSTSMNNISNNGNGEGFVKKPLPNNFPIDKPQPPTPPVQDNIQQQKKSHDIYHQRNNSQSQFTPYQISSNNNIPIAPTVIGVTNNNHNNNNNNNNINNNNNTPSSIAPSTISQHQQQQQQYMINGPGDLRRSQPDYTNAANNGPLSSQQQQISQNLSMKSKSSNRNYQQQPEGPGDARRLSNSPNMFSSPPPISSQVQYQSPQGGYQQVQGQMNPQNLVLTQGRISPRQITASPSHTPSNNINNNNLNDLNRSDTQRTTSSNTSNNSLGIQLDVNGRVKQDDLAEAFIANGGRLPPESAKFQTRPQGIPQGGQMSPQGQPIFQYNSFNRPLQQMPTNPSVITSQSSYNGPHQQLQQQSHPQVHRSNTVNSGSTLNNAFPYKQPQQGVNVNSQLPQGSIGRPQGSIGRPQGSIGRPPLRRTLPVGIQQSQSQPQIQPTQLLQQPIGTQVLGHPQTHYQNPNFYSPPVSGYPRPPIGSANIGGNAQGFQQMQVPQQQLMQQQPPLQLQPYTSLTASQQQPQQQQQQLPQQMNLQTLHLQYQRQSLPGSDIPDSSGSQNHPRTEDGKPIEFYVKALYDYQKTIPEEMSFTTGDVIAVLSTHSDGWWEGEIVDDSRKNRGLFPSNYTKVLE